MIRSTIAAFSIAALALFSSSSALASDHCSKADADIKDICGQLIPDGPGFRVTINYKVKIEDARPGEPFDLVMAIRQNGRQIFDETGREVVFVVPLVFPNDRCRDEVVFRSGLQNQIGRCDITCPKDVEVCARVVSVETGKVLDKEDEDLKFVGCVRVYEPIVVRPAPVIVRPAPVIVQPAPVVVHRRVYVAPRPARYINVGVGVAVDHGVGVDVHYNQGHYRD